jgi:acyl transferase domain-containing protein/NAD(P)H-dependent flavin oxidoreductase YrpB (nitropropane dioxygenase family)/NAD(P)-dependent dehydrogenase (short-subunit alcohol dehydrogenase family)
MHRFGRERLGIQVGRNAASLLPTIFSAKDRNPSAVIFCGPFDDSLQDHVKLAHDAGCQAYLVATDAGQALVGLSAGVDALIAKGNEAGGWVGEESSFVLLQRLLGLVRATASSPVPVWAQGGIGLHSVAACMVAGAAGVVLDSQVLLARESPLTASLRDRVATMDGSETRSFGVSLGAQFRAYEQPHLRPVAELRELETRLIASGAANAGTEWREQLEALVDWRDPSEHIFALGQDACFAASLAERFGTVAGIIEALRVSALSHCEIAKNQPALAPGSALAHSHGTDYPLVQGPMTRVSDRAEFAAAVADAGALPLIALALMREPEVDALLGDTSQLLGERPWGVGILGFVPPELRAEQLAVVRRYHPPFAVIAGGRPDQARVLEEDGIATYLHVPSPTLLHMYMRDGAKRFVFEGRECGGHVGPRTSFILWDSMVEALLAALPAKADPSEYHVLFAGGIHDDVSGAMVSALAAPLVERGVRVGALMGTAYLFTEEVVQSGAITGGFQQAALTCDSTVLLVSGPGQATRCLPSPFVDAFESEKRRLLELGLSNDALKNELEILNIGRLRIASKGLDRHPMYGEDPTAPKLAELSDDEQWQRGMYMIGQVAGLRHGVCTMRDLHRGVANGSAELLADLASDDGLDEPEPLAPADVAIVGLGCILPGAADLATYWSNILNKVDAITEVPESRWDWRNYYDPDRSARDKVYSKWGGFIDDVPFDPIAFGMPPASLKSIEPFQLLALLVVQSALKDAGYLNRPFARERTSVILGAGGGGADLSGDYMVRSSLPDLLGAHAAPLVEQLGPALPEWTEDSFPGILMNVAAGRVANRFDFGGTNFTIDAACASSLAAIYLAVRDLQSGSSDVAIAGGVDAIHNPFAFLCFSKTQALSPTGRCRPFDAKADGIAISEGFAAIVLKRLDDAERDGDRIYAVIRGVGSASDGRDRSLTAPRPEGQIRALHRAYRHAGFSPATVGLVEAHGTGTVAGDQAEIQSLTSCFTSAGAGVQQCAIGSVKSMIGHTKAAAGVAGLIKVALALHHKVLPPTLGVTEPNPKANFEVSPFYVNTEARPWASGIDGNPRRAGVSAFGFGGTNFHIVLEEYTGNYVPDQESFVSEWPAELLVWRGSSREQLRDAIIPLIHALDAGAQPVLADLSYTLATNAATEAGDATLVIVAESTADAAEKLRAAREILASPVERQHTPAGVHYVERPMARDGKVAFIFPGQGSQTVNMGRDLAILFPEVLAAFESADQALAGAFDRPLSSFIFPPPAFSTDTMKRQRAALTETNIAQPALGVTELAYLQLLLSFGVEPDTAAGHSYGEFVALYAAGSFDEETLLRLSEARGRFMKEGATGDSGTMAAVMAGPDVLQSLLETDGITLANLNAPQQTVLSGSVASIERAIEWCKERGLRAQRLPVACAFHSPFVAPAQQRLTELLRESSIAAPRIPVYSNTTARPYPTDREAIVDLLSEHIVRPVDWVGEITAMYDDGARLFVEVGPRTVLSNLVGQQLANQPHVCVSVEQSGSSGLVQFLNALAMLASEGVPVQFDRLFQGRAVRRIEPGKVNADREGPAVSATTWLVNGGEARPAAAALRSEARPNSNGITSVESVALMQSLRVGLPDSQVVAANGSSGATPAATIHADDTLRHQSSTTGGDEHAIERERQFAVQGNGAQPMTDSHLGLARASDDASWGNAPGRVRADATSQPPRLQHTPAVDAGWAGSVVDRFQDVMRHFLDVQRDVMLTYLSGASPAANARPNYQFVASSQATVLPPMSHPNGNAPHGIAPPAAEHHPRPGIPTEVTAYTNGASQPSEVDHAPSNGNQVRPLTETGPQAAPIASSPVAETPLTAPALDRQAITTRLLTVVSERTGYPTEMLDLDANLEADLGIDSIKRVEIIGMITQSLPVSADTALDTEQLTTSQTLRQVIDLLEAFVIGKAAQPPEAAEARLPFDEAPSDSRVGRFVLNTIELLPANHAGKLASDGVVVIADDELGTGVELERRLIEQGLSVVRVVIHSGGVASTDVITIDPTLPDATSNLTEMVQRLGRAAALIYLPALRLGSTDETVQPHEPIPLFVLAKALLSDLEESAANGGAALVGATRMGGAFASNHPAESFHPFAGAVHGFLKTAALEWPTIRVKSLDFGPVSANDVADRVVDELFSIDDVVEVGYLRGKRVTLDLRPAPLHERSADLPLDHESVVVVTGGARGITAETLVTLAREYQPTLLLVGRTPPPEGPEAAATVGITDPAVLKRAIIEQQRRAGENVTPAAVESIYRRLLREREVRENLQRLQEAGAKVNYFVCDVRDDEAFGALIDQIYDSFGRIDGVIHGAGIIEDKLIRDKQLASLDRVIGTKVDGALVLSTKLRPETLRFLVLFSSISGRFGNRGQGDYAAASEVLNKLALKLNQSWPAHIVSINWGPWLTTGMVSPQVRQQFAERGVELITIEAGCRFLHDELRFGRKGEVEVLIGGQSNGGANPDTTGDLTLHHRAATAAIEPVSHRSVPLNSQASTLPLLSVNSEIAHPSKDVVVVERVFDPNIDRYLNDHRIDSRPVLPFAMAMEFMAETAAAMNSTEANQELVALSDIQLLRGVIVDGHRTILRSSATRREAATMALNEPSIEVIVEISGTADPHVSHYRAVAELGSAESFGSRPGNVAIEPLKHAAPFPMAVEDAYRNLLFHGPLMQGIVSIDGFSPEGIQASLRSSHPVTYTSGPQAGPWLFDPVLMDSAFQLQVLWARVNWDITLLPANLESCRRYQRWDESWGSSGAPFIRHEMRIRPESRPPLCRADHAFYCPDGRLLYRVTGVVGVGSKQLNRLGGTR